MEQPTAEARRAARRAAGVMTTSSHGKTSAAKVRAPLELVPRARSARTNVIPSLTVLVGRHEVLARLAADVAGGHRLLTLVGPPGMGKTRVARAFLEAHGARYATHGGAYFCDLSEAKTESDLTFAIANLVAAKVPEHAPAVDAIARLEEIVADAGPMILVLDNFEQLTFAATLVRRLCAVAKDLVVIVTSRERLSVEGEVVVELPPLALPDEGATDLESEAARLFLDRARQAGARLLDGPEAVARDARYVVDIVRKLEGIPLAIELFAARTRLHSAKDLSARLAREDGLFATVRRRDDSRHGTLEGAIEGSWSLLAPEERDVLARCSVFAGGFSTDVFTATLGEDALDALASLRDKSLVYATPTGRVAMYTSIRVFAAKKLAEAGEDLVNAVRGTHAAALATMAAAFVDSRNMPEKTGKVAPRFGDLRHEKENLVAALAHVTSRPRAPETLAARADLAAALALLLVLPAEDLEGELGAALDAFGDEGEPIRRVGLLLARQSVRNALGKYRDCQSDLASIRAMTGLPLELRALARVYEGIQLRYQGRAAEALPCHEDAARELEGLGFARLSAMNTACMGRLMCDLGDAARARELDGLAFASSEAAGDVWLGALCLANLAQVEQEAGAFEAAKRLLERAFERLRDMGETHYEAIYAGVLGDLFLEAGDLAAARPWYAHGARFLNRFATHRQTGILHAAAAALESECGDFVTAMAHLEKARACADRVDNPVVRLVVSLHTTTVSLLRAPTDERGRVAASADLRALADGHGEDTHVYRTSLDVRFAARILRRTLTKLSTAPEARRAAIFVASTTRTYVSPEGTTIDLMRRGSLYRILEALLDRRENSPDRGLSVDELFTAGWPGERVLAAAAQTRVRVAVATLRKLGLRDVLVTRDDGYLVSPDVTIVRDAR